ncbi:MAG TPA: response regulator [Microvirga sp.]|jgi:CheY-like chemotaxis protein|nr:response regulator [Microvirga sp.]
MLSADPRTATVLLVEDDPVTRELAVQILQAGGFAAVAAPTGERALLALREVGAAFDWLVTKADLPGLVCGFVVADEFRTRRPGRPVVLTSDRLAATGSAPRGAIVARERAPYDLLDILRGLAAMAALAGQAKAAARAA